MSTVLKIFPLSSLTSPSTSIVTLPALPCPDVLLSSRPPLVTKRDSAIISIPSLLPIPSSVTWLNNALLNPLLPSIPSKETVPVALILTSPALPFPKVLLVNPPPLVAKSEPVEIVIPLLLPLAFCPT